MAVLVNTPLAGGRLGAAGHLAGLRSAATRTAALLSVLSPALSHADMIEDSQLNLGLRNFYIDKDFKGDSAAKSRVGSWTQGFDLRLQSGYSEGPLQFALEASAQYAHRLDGGGGRGLDTIIPYDDEKREQVKGYGRAAATAKVRYSKTELSIGEHRPRLPVAFFDDTRQLASTFHGVQISSQEIAKLNLTAGRFDRIATRESSNHEKLYLFTGPNGARRPSDGLNFAGATYAFSPSLSASYFYGQLEDIYQQHYLGLTHNLALGGGYSLKNDVRYYNNREDGDALYGDVDNRTYGLMSALKKDGHTFTLGYQRMLGHSNFPTLNGFTPQPYLVNWSAQAFIMPNERSWQVRYDYDFAAMGVPGLSAMARYIRGTGIDRGNALSDSMERERGLQLNYVVQSGPLAGVGFTWFNINVKPQHSADYDENRLITTYTWKLW
jgi:hypothetical protein